MENTLYFDHANIYHHIANDRDFSAECTLLNSLYEQVNHSFPEVALELFAGPAYHGICLQEQGVKQVFAIDYSEEMRNIACEINNFSVENYILDSLPQAMRHLPADLQLDVVYIMRYSLGLISYEAAQQLLTNICERLKPGGMIIFELHKISMLSQHLTSLEIKTRVKKDPKSGQSFACTWPSGPIMWQDEDWSITMPIKVEIKSHSGEMLSSFETLSREYIFVQADISRMVKKMNNIELLKTPSNIADYFSQSKIIILRKEK